MSVWHEFIITWYHHLSDLHDLSFYNFKHNINLTVNTDQDVLVLSEPKRKTIKWDDDQVDTLLQQMYVSKPYAFVGKKAAAYEDVAFLLMKTVAFKWQALSS